MSTKPTTPQHAELPPLPDGFEYGLEVGECLRLAAWLGHRATDEPPISFSSMLIAFLIHDRPVSKWFQKFATSHRVKTTAIFSERSFNVSQLPQTRTQVASGNLPTTAPFMSQSFQRVLGNALDIAKQVGGINRTLGGRHIMAAYAIYQLPDHVDRVLRWGIDPEVWKRQFLIFATKQYPKEGWDQFARTVYGTADWNLATPSASAPKAQNKRAPPKAAPPPPDLSNAPNVAPNAPAEEPAEEEEEEPAESAQSAADPASSPPPQLPTTLYSEYGGDNPFADHIDDLLKVNSEAAAFARLVAAKDISPPLAIGIFGEWGSGKTFFMRRVREQIKELSEEATKLQGEEAERWPYLEDVVHVQFDAWHYAEENLWASLVDYIFAALDAWMLDKSQADPAGVDHVLDRLATTQQLKLDALETLIQRRSERQTAEARAAKARVKYQEAQKRREAIQPSSYLLAAIKAYAKQDSKLGKLRKEATDSLGIPELQETGERLESAINEARTEAGRAHLVTRSLFAKLGKGWGIAGILGVLVVIPSLVVGLKELLENVTVLSWLNEIKGTATAVTTFIAGALISVSKLVGHAREGLSKLSKLDEQLQKQIEDNRADFEESADANQDRAAQRELQKSRQAFEAAEAALMLADANLLAAKQDFESGTARGRLNQFIRSKVTSGEYAKHLGIVAAIRRDFSQLASLMNMSNNEEQEKEDRERLAKDALARVDRFIAWLKSTKEVKLTISEVEAVMNFLEPAAAVEKLEAHDELLKELLPEQAGDLAALKLKLETAALNPRELPRFSRIVLYIDDLDRCPAKKVVDVLQAVHLLLSFPLFAVVVAVDARWVSRALRDHYPGLLADANAIEMNEGEARVRAPGEDAKKHLEAEERRITMDRALRSQEAGGARPYDYLEKIFQIPYWVRAMDRTAASDFVEGIASAKKKKREVKTPPPPVAPAAPSGSAIVKEENIFPPNADGTPQTPETPVQENVDPPVQQKTSVLDDSRVHEGVSLEKAEVAMLKRFAPFVGDTPRRAIRFVNIYRLVKTSMPDEMRDTLVGKDGRSARYRALISQLAVANGMPQVASYFFEQVSRTSAESSIQQLQTSILADAGRYAPGTLQQLPMLMTALQSSGKDIPEAEALTVKHMQDMIGFARRYSFERR